MTNLIPSMRLKVKRDTFFLPDSNNGVYFRNNESSFHMEGSMIDQWVEKLMPMLNGENTLESLTDELPDLYRDRVYEIAEVLYQNGFARDVSQDRPHQLTEQVLKTYGSQIEFLDSFVDSGAHRFQEYRQAKVLAIGSGPFFVSLVSALLESGLPKFDVCITNSVPTNRQRLKELIAHARNTDYEVGVEEISTQNDGVNSWREIVQPFHSILYVSQEGDVEELRVLHSICREEKKVLLPAICLQQVGLAGPLVHPESEACWESAWRRIHQSVVSKDQQLPSSSVAGAMLANVIVFELFKEITGVVKSSEQNNQFFLLDLNTLEGSWHSFMPHPLVTGRASAKWVQDFDTWLEQDGSRSESSELLLYFSQLTSAESGIFHIWEEGVLQQLPLAQCRVQAVDPLSEGPAELLPEIICTGLTHEEARREAGLIGIESYVTRAVGLLHATLPPDQEVENSMIEGHESVGVGSGETFAEGVCRGLQNYLDKELRKRQVDQKNFITQVQLDAIEDDRCRFYLQSLTTMQGVPIIGLEEEVSGFPVVWVGTKESWYRSVGLNITMAMQKALQLALMRDRNRSEVSPILLEEAMPIKLVIPAMEGKVQSVDFQSALEVLERNHNRLFVIELALEPFLKEELAGVFGVLLREEESR